MDNYKTLKNSLNEQEQTSPRLRGWLNYQRHRRIALTEKKKKEFEEKSIMRKM